VSRFRLRSEAFHFRGYATILDPTDITGQFANVEERFTDTPHRTVVVEWTPRSKTDGALVPLFLTHTLAIVPGKETPELERALYAYGVVLTGDVTAPKELTFERPHATATVVPISGALNSPLQLNARDGS